MPQWHSKFDHVDCLTPSILQQTLAQSCSGITGPVAATTLQLGDEKFDDIDEAPGCVGGEQNESVAAAFIDVLVHLVGDVGGRADGDGSAHRDAIDLCCLTDRHRSSVLGFEDGIEEAANALHIGLDHVVIEVQRRKVKSGVARKNSKRTLN